MSLDTSSLPIGGSTLLGLVLYVGTSLWVGQIVAEREVAKSNWLEVCERQLRHDISSRRSKASSAAIVPRLDCNSTLGRLDPELRKLCLMLGNPDPVGDARRTEEAARRKKEELLARTAAAAPGRCACARDVYQQERMFALGLYAGSGRLISLPPVQAMKRELGQNLNGPHCQGGVQ